MAGLHPRFHVVQVHNPHVVLPGNEDPTMSVSSQLEIEEQTQTQNRINALMDACLVPNMSAASFAVATHVFSEYMELLETEYQEQSEQYHGAFDEDLRQSGYRIGWALEAIADHEEFLDHIVTKLLATKRSTSSSTTSFISKENTLVQTAICRALVSNLLGLNSHVVSLCANDLSLVDMLLALVDSEQAPLRCYATGLLSGALLDRTVQDRVIKTNIIDILFKRVVRSQLLEQGRFFFAFPYEQEVTDDSSATDDAAPILGSDDNLPERFTWPFDDSADADLVDVDAVELLRKECGYAIQCIACLGEYQETLKPVLESDVLGVFLPLLEGPFHHLRLDVVDLLWHLLAHKTFAAMFVARSGVELLLKIVKDHELTHPIQHCVLLCFTGVASLSGVMEQVCKLPDQIPLKMVQHALRALNAPREHHRRNAALFFSVSLAYPVFLRHFDDSAGMLALLTHLEHPMRGIITDHRRVREVPATSNTVPTDTGAPSASTAATAPSISQLPWTCAECSTVNNSYPSECETCDSPNPNYRAPPSTSSLAARNVIRVSGLFNASSPPTLRPRLGSDASSLLTPSAAPVTQNEPDTSQQYYTGHLPAERRIAHSLAMGLRQFFRAHLALIASVLRRRTSLKRRQAKHRSVSGGPSSVAGGTGGGTKGRRPRLDSWSSGPSHQVLPYKAVGIDDKAAKRNLAMVERHSEMAMPILVASRWAPTDGFLRYSGAKVLLQVVAAASGADAKHSFVLEAAAYALDALKIVSLVPSVAESICTKSSFSNKLGATILVNAAMGSAHESASITKKALDILSHCVEIRHHSECILHPYPVLAGHSAQRKSGKRGCSGSCVAGGLGMTGKQCRCVIRNADDHVIQKKLRALLRSKDAIKVCFALLRYRRVAAEGDSIRHKVSRVLLGLARDRQVGQIIGKMNVGKVITELRAKGPTLDAYKIHFQRFCVYTSELMSILSGRNGPGDGMTSMHDIERVKAINRSNVNFSKEELFVVIRQHLLANGLFQSARALAEEANLDLGGFNEKGRKKSENRRYCWPKRGAEISPKHLIAPAVTRKVACAEGAADLNSSVAATAAAADPSHRPVQKRRRADSLPAETNSPFRSSKAQKTVAADSSMLPGSTVTFTSQFLNASSPKPLRRSLSSTTPKESDRRYKSGGQMTDDHIKFRLGKRHSSAVGEVKKHLFSPELLKRSDSGTMSEGKKVPTEDPLTGIVKAYLRGKMSAWSNPIEVLPTLSLLEPQSCPEGRPYAPWDAPQNVTHQVLSRQLVGGTGGRGGRTRSHEIVYGNFRKIRVYKEEESVLTCSTFLNHVNGADGCHFLAAGNDNGQVRLYNMWSTDIVHTFVAHEAAVASVATSPVESQKHRLLLTSSTVFEAKLFDLTKTSTIGGSYSTLSECYSPSFSHRGDRIVGNKLTGGGGGPGSGPGQRHKISIYDVETMVEMLSLDDTSDKFTYPISTATFDVTDNLVVCDGKLWDVRSKRLLYRFDKLGNTGNAVFHPAGNQLLIDSAVWDLRTRKLVQMAPALDRSEVRFSSLGDAVFVYPRPATGSMLRDSQKEVRVLNGSTYMDLGKPLPIDKLAADLCIDQTDGYILITDHGYSPLECRISLYEIGRRKPNDADSDMDDAQDDSDSDDPDDEDGGWASGRMGQTGLLSDMVEMDELIRNSELESVHHAGDGMGHMGPDEEDDLWFSDEDGDWHGMGL